MFPTSITNMSDRVLGWPFLKLPNKGRRMAGANPADPMPDRWHTSRGVSSPFLGMDNASPCLRHKTRLSAFQTWRLLDTKTENDKSRQKMGRLPDCSITKESPNEKTIPQETVTPRVPLNSELLL